MSDATTRLDPILQLVRNLVIAVEDGAVSPDEGRQIFEGLATVIETLAVGVDRWILRWSLRAGAAALREAADHIQELPGWQYGPGED